MSDETPPDLNAWFRSSESWATDRETAFRHTLKVAWIVAIVLGVIALLEAIAIVVMMPLKTVVPYTLLVDKQTGAVEELKPLDRQTTTPDRALTRSFLAQYVIAREGFDIDSFRDDYRKTALWSAGEARDRYIAGMQATNPASPLVSLPRRALVQVNITGISSLSADTALVRFSTTRTDPGGQAQPPQPWQAVIAFRFNTGTMAEADRLTNPLGFQVTRYRRDAEIPPEPVPVTTGVVGDGGVPSATATVAAPTVAQPVARAATQPLARRAQ